MKCSFFRPTIYQLFTCFNEGNSYLLSTDKMGDDFKYMWMVPERPFFIFSVSVCSDASVALSNRPGEAKYDAYVVTLGTQANSKSEIMKGGKVVREVPTPNILQCAEMRRFWISWKNSNIMVQYPYQTLYFKL